MCFDHLVMNCMLVALLVSLANFVGLELGHGWSRYVGEQDAGKRVVGSCYGFQVNRTGDAPSQSTH
jgi:hypothetical protein